MQQLREERDGGDAECGVQSRRISKFFVNVSTAHGIPNPHHTIHVSVGTKYFRAIGQPPMSSNALPNGSASHNDPVIPHIHDSAKTGDAATAATAVLKPSIPMPSTSTKIRGVDFNDYVSTPITVAQLTSHFTRTGFQASNLSRAIEIINNMVILLLRSKLITETMETRLASS